MGNKRFGNRSREKDKSGLSVEVFFRLKEIFEEKSWDIEHDEENPFSVFNRFCSCLSKLDSEQQLLLLELTERFKRIKQEEYPLHISKALTKFAANEMVNFSEIKNIFVTPLLAPEDFGKPKSSTFVYYSLKGILPYTSAFVNKKYFYLDGIDQLDIRHKDINKDNSILLVVDDFVGTGDTSISALSYLIKEKKITKDKIVVLTIAAMEQGFSNVEEFGNTIHTSFLLEKGISDFYPEDKAIQNFSIMDAIDRKIKTHTNEKYGYGESEALISLIRTPNNTFPIFWKEKGDRIAPFPRH